MTAILFPVDQNDVALLKDQWDELLSPYTSDIAIKNTTFNLLEDRYSEESRFYHNLSHIQFLLNLFALLKDKIQEHNVVRFSIWFHDAVYDPKRDDNEEESARLASEVLGELMVNAETVAVVREMILATQSHSGRFLSEDAKLFLDMDLAILGVNPETYAKYSKAIRAEYAWVPDTMFRIGRRKILESFVNRETIYFTNVIQKRFEEQARRNIDSEIRALAVQPRSSA